MSDYLPILVMSGLVIAFVLLSFVASQLLAPQRGNTDQAADDASQQQITYELRHCVFDLDDAVNGCGDWLDCERRSSCLD